MKNNPNLELLTGKCAVLTVRKKRLIVPKSVVLSQAPAVFWLLAYKTTFL
jgi:hypothetical protein